MPTLGKSHSVLIVEDERIVAKDLQATLREMGYDPFAIAASAEEALRFAAERCPDVVLMDIRIQGSRDGIEVATMLRRRFDLPIVYLTAHADDATIARASETEPHGYLTKPVKPGELRSAIEIAVHKHQIERRLRERGRWFSTTFDSIEDAVIAVDLAGNINFMNPAAERLTGIPATTALGAPAREVVQLLDHTPSSPLDHVLEHRRSHWVREATLKHASGVNPVISDSIAPVIEAGEMLGAVMVFRDITESRRIQKQLELADRLLSLGTMAAGVAHEVNNPLAVIVAHAALALEELRASVDGTTEATRLETIDALGAIESASARIARIVSELQAFARPTKLPTGNADVSEAVAWALRSTSSMLQNRATVATKLPPGARVALDETRLGQVLVNLLTNAAHAIEPGAVDRNTVSVEAQVEASMVVIDIRDTGCGMPPEVVKRVFEPFFTTKPVGAGTGLGLSICHGMVTSAGGTVEVDSTPGAGSRFRIRLPAVLGTQPEQLGNPRRITGPTRRARILVIDDDPMILKAMERMLRGHDVTPTDDARRALELLGAGEKFDIIFSDLSMPYMSGMEFYERLLGESFENVARVVFLTGGAVTSKTAAFLATVPNTHLEKPIGVAMLRAVVEERLALAP